MKKNQSKDSSTISEYVVLQTVQMDVNKASNIDDLSSLLQESDSVTNFRKYLDSISRGHFLDFWFACQGYRNYFDKSDSHKLYQLTKVIYRAYIRSESPYAVPLSYNAKQNIVDKLSERNYHVDHSIFDEGQSEIKELLSGDLLKTFLASSYFTEPQVNDRMAAINNALMTNIVNDVSTTTMSTNNDGITNGNNCRYSNINRQPSTDNNDSMNIVSKKSVDMNNDTGCANYNINSINIDKDRRNLSEVEPAAFAKIITEKLEEVQLEQLKFERLMCIMARGNNSGGVGTLVTAGGRGGGGFGGTGESDTDDSSHSSRAAISYLLRCQQQQMRASTAATTATTTTCTTIGSNYDNTHNPLTLSSSSSALIAKATRKLRSTSNKYNNNSNNNGIDNNYMFNNNVVVSIDNGDDAQNILESHCSRIGTEPTGTGCSSSRLPRRNRDYSDYNSKSSSRRRQEIDIGSTTSYDSGVATSSLEQYSNLGVSGSIMILGNNPTIGCANTTNQASHWPPISSPSLPPLPPLSNRFRDSRNNNSNHHHHHHHHHHHRSNKQFNYSRTPEFTLEDCYKDPVFSTSSSKNQAPFSDVSSAFDSGISSAYEHLGRRLKPLDDKVTNWITCQTADDMINQYSSCHQQDSYHHQHQMPSTLTQPDIPPNTPLIQPASSANSRRHMMFTPPPMKSSSSSSSTHQNHQYLPSSSLIDSVGIDSAAAAAASSSLSGSVNLFNSDNSSVPLVSCNNNSTIHLNKCHCSGSNNYATKPNSFNTIQTNPISTSTTNTFSNGPLIIGYYIGNDPVPYRTQIPDAQSTSITLAQFKSIVAKKGNFRYFFKQYCDEFDCGAVHEEITKDDSILPLWEGKIVAKIEKAD